MKAKDLKVNGVKIELQGTEYEIKFNMNTFCELEDIYGSINKAFDDLEKGRFKAIRALIFSSLKTQNNKLTIEKVGEMLGFDNIVKVSEAIERALDISMPEIEEAYEDDEKN